MKKIECAVLLLLCFISSQAHATTIVTIENKTDFTCKLEAKNLKYGILLTYPPLRIHHDELWWFSITSGRISGSEIELTYDCNGQKINIHCEESLLLGTASAMLIHADPGITGTYKIKHAWDFETIQWVISKN